MNPLPPYRFILCAKSISYLIEYKEYKSALSKVLITQGRTKLNIYFLANDSLILCEANSLEMHVTIFAGNT